MLFPLSLKTLISTKIIYSRFMGNTINRIINDDEFLVKIENINDMFGYDFQNNGFSFIMEHPITIINTSLLFGLFIWYNYDMVFQNQRDLHKLEKLPMFQNIGKYTKIMNIVFIMFMMIFMKNVESVL